MKLSTSILSIKDNLNENIEKLSNTTTDYIHLDVMDGIFVPNKSLEYNEMVKTNKNLDVHLMVQNVYKYIDIYKELKPEFITVHLEIDENLFDVMEYIKSLGIKAGISIKPNTEIGSIVPYLHMADLILVMSVEPGKGGQSFIQESKEKIDALKVIKKLNNYNYEIEVDGGINDETIELCHNANIVVVGSFITNDNNYQKQIDKLGLYK